MQFYVGVSEVLLVRGRVCGGGGVSDLPCRGAIFWSKEVYLLITSRFLRPNFFLDGGS